MTDLADMSTNGFVLLHDDFRIAHDPHDAWGSVMNWLFAVADVLYHHDPDLIPDAWQYHHGEGCDGNTPDNPDQEIQDGLDDGTWTPEDLVAFGNVLDRWSDMLRAAGEDY